ncbi:MAG: ELM1/GtrOC1 family putative glycosyltransferase, partial [Pseudomonadota bacterium]
MIIASPRKKGHERQAAALAERLGCDTTVRLAADVARDIAAAAAYDLVLAAGRQSISVARVVARNGGPVVVVLQPVLWRAGLFDLIWAPAHDRAARKMHGRFNLVETLTAPCAVTPQAMSSGASALSDIDLGPPPHVGVLIGGRSRSHRFGTAETEELAARLAAFAKTHEATLLVTTSRRTPAAAAPVIAQRLGPGHLVFDAHQPGGRNAATLYPGILGLASAFIVTNDSYAMMSEAAFTGKPIYGWRLPGGKAKFERFYTSLQDHGALRWFDGSLENWHYPPLDAAATIADALAP